MLRGQTRHVGTDSVVPSARQTIPEDPARRQLKNMLGCWPPRTSTVDTWRRSEPGAEGARLRVPGGGTSGLDVPWVRDGECAVVLM